MEVKGVTLEKEGNVFFPDAPTIRGVKHLNGLAQAKKDGFETFLLLVIQMKGIRKFYPNDETHKAFGDAFGQQLQPGYIFWHMTVSFRKIL